ncbi:MAG TPA: styrene monooxygenase/indole monooxygenase family protein [Acidimicrobiales bacterium]|nr:styrene monooxygenase/indole monooxygenase family protein [Acidimicrobiales bacterium]
MTGIAIAGAGISGLTLALRLQQQGVDTTVYSAQTPDQIRSARLLNLVARFEPTLARERQLGVNHWDFPDFAMFGAHVSVVGTPIAFWGALPQPARFVDFRMYLARLLEDYAERGGDVVIDRAPVAEAVRRSAAYDLVVVAGGRESSDLFPRDPSRSPYDRPQRVVCAGTFRGIAFPEPLGLSFNISPGAGEVFQSPVFTFGGRVSGVLFEGVPGGPFEPLVHMAYADDPVAFERHVLDLFRVHAPSIYERVDQAEFGLTRPVDLLQGAIIPTVRRAWTPLGSGRFAVAVGDAWIVNDPLTGQGANLGSHCAWVLAESILDDAVYDELFCRQVEERMWRMAGPVTEWSNAFLLPPPPHVVELLGAAAADPAVADALVGGFADPQVMWRRVATPERAAAFLAAARSTVPVSPAGR